MSYLMQSLLKKKTELETFLRKTEHSLEEAPEGLLRVSENRPGKPKYYQIMENRGRLGRSDRIKDRGKTENAVNPGGRYIRSSETGLPVRLAQKSYDTDLKRILIHQLKMIDRMLKQYDPAAVSRAYEKLSAGRKILVTPVRMTDEDFIRNWEKKADRSELNSYEFTGDIYTLNEEHVRSKSEKIIADTLKYYGIPYKYEQMIRMSNGHILYPDFTVLNVKERTEIYWEHFGRMDDPEYAVRTISKLEEYEANGIILGRNLIATFESLQMPLSQRQISRKIEIYCERI